MAISLLAKELDALRKVSTPAICDAIDSFNVRPRNEGFMASGIRCIFPELGSMVGYAVTARIMTDEPPAEGHQVSRLDWWDFLQGIPKPRVVVVQDLDRMIRGTYWDQQTVHIHKALGCVGVVTDGGVRDLDVMHVAPGVHRERGVEPRRQRQGRAARPAVAGPERRGQGLELPADG